MGEKAISVNMRAISETHEASGASKKAIGGKSPNSVKNELKIKC